MGGDTFVSINYVMFPQLVVLAMIMVGVDARDIMSSPPSPAKRIALAAEKVVRQARATTDLMRSRLPRTQWHGGGLPSLNTAARLHGHSLIDLSLTAMKRPRRAASAAVGSVTDLRHSLLLDSRGALNADARRRAWMGIAAGALCGVAAVAMAGLCVCLTTVELVARGATVVTSALSCELAAWARFGSAAGRGEAPPPLQLLRLEEQAMDRTDTECLPHGDSRSSSDDVTESADRDEDAGTVVDDHMDGGEVLVAKEQENSSDHGNHGQPGPGPTR